MKTRCMIAIISFLLGAVFLAPAATSAQSIALEAKKLSCEKDHLTMSTAVTNNRGTALKVTIAAVLRDADQRCLQAATREFELQPGEKRPITFEFDKAPCAEGRYRTDHKIIHDYVPRMTQAEKFEELFRQPELDGVPLKYQNLFKKFDAEAKEQLITAVKSGDFEWQLKNELNSFVLECP